MGTTVSPWLLLVFLAINFCASCFGSSLTFVIDDTLSMTNDIDQVKQDTKTIANIVLQSKEINNIVLVTFNDPADPELKVNKGNHDEFKRALERIIVYGGGDCPERSLAGILLALEESEPRSYIYVFTDASAKDYVLNSQVQELCQRKQSQIIFVLTGDCGYPGSTAYQVYYDIASASSGIAFRVEKHEVTNVIRTINETINAVTPLTRRTIPAYKWTEVQICIDGQTDYAIMSAYGSNIYVNTTVYKTQTIMSTTNGQVIKLVDPPSGCNNILVWAVSPASVEVTSKNHFSFRHGFSSLEPKSLDDTAPQPFADTMTHLSVLVTDRNNAVRVQSMQILDMDEVVTKTLPLNRLSPNFYTTELFVAPLKMFKIAYTIRCWTWLQAPLLVDLNNITRNYFQLIGEEIKTGATLRRLGALPITPQKAPPGTTLARAPMTSIAEGSSITVTKDSPITLTCKVVAYPKPHIVWKDSRGNVVPSESSTVQIPYDHISYLKIQHETNENRYTCHATNTVNQHFSSIDVNMDPFVIANVPQGKTILPYGAIHSINCDVRAAIPTRPLEIHWFFKDKRTGNSKEIFSSKDYSISTDSTQLTIQYMDDAVVGKYTCAVSVKANPGNKREFTTDVDIKSEPARIIPDGSIYNGVVGDAALRLPCKAIGYPKPNIQWEAEGSPITQNDKYNVVQDGSLIIKKPTTADTKNYTCKAVNSGGSDSRTMEGNVYNGLYDFGTEHNIYLLQGQSKQLKCNLPQSIHSTLAWFSDNQGNTGYIPSLLNVPYVSIVNADAEKHDGNYTCRVSYENGTVITETYVVDVGYPPTFEYPRDGSLLYWSGGKAEMLNCDVDSKPESIVEWIMDGKLLPDENASRLTISKYNVGRYTCTVTNPHASIQMEFDVQLVKPSM